MSNINSYSVAGNPLLTDKLIGSEQEATKNFTIQELLGKLGGGAQGAKLLTIPSFLTEADAEAAGLKTGQLWKLPGGTGTFLMTIK
tara:strand:+ start:9940 stop:10197 length:258 start_codon:yes stop_codon:yes gene_type:complete